MPGCLFVFQRRITFGDRWCKIFLQSRNPCCRPSNAVKAQLISVLL